MASSYSLAPAAPPDAQIHSIPGWIRGVAIACILFFGFCSVMVLLLRAFEPGKPKGAAMVFLLLLFGGFMLGGVWLFRACAARIATTSQGVWYLLPNKPSIFLRWSEISRIEEHPFAQRLILVDSIGGTRIKVEYQLRDFEQLRRLILEKATSRTPDFRRPVVFHPLRAVYVMLISSVVFFTAFACVSASQGSATSLIFTGFALVGVIALFSGRSSIQVLEDNLVLVYPLWRRAIPYSDIRNIHLRNVTGTKGNSIAVVIVETGGKPLRLGGFREGSIVLYETLCERWQKATALH